MLEQVYFLVLDFAKKNQFSFETMNVTDLQLHRFNTLGEAVSFSDWNSD